MPSATSFTEAFTKTVLIVHCDTKNYITLFPLQNTRGPLKSDPIPC